MPLNLNKRYVCPTCKRIWVGDWPDAAPTNGCPICSRQDVHGAELVGTDHTTVDAAPAEEVLYVADQGPRADFDAKLEALGVQPLDGLQRKRQQLYHDEGKQYAYLKTMYGPFGSYEDLRKRSLEGLRLRFLKPTPEDLTAHPLPEKSTESFVEAWCRAHPEYIAMADAAHLERQRFVLYALEEQEITEQIESRLREMSFVTSESRNTK